MATAKNSHDALGNSIDSLTPPRLARADLLLIIAIFVTALALRLIYIDQLRSSPLFADPTMDELYHDQWAQSIVDGKTYIEGPYFRAPLYPGFLAAIYKTFGQGYLAPRVVQAIMGSLSCVIMFLLGRMLFGRLVGAISAFAAATYWMLIYFDGELLIPSLVVFLDLLLVWLLAKGAHTRRCWPIGLAGVALGASAIARPNVLLVAPAIVIWLAVLHRREPQHAFKRIASITAGCLLVVLPITIRNYVVGKDLVLISSQAGVNFYIGNNPQSDGRTAIVPGTPGGWWEGYRATIARAQQASGRELKPSEVSRYYFGEAVDYILKQPGKFLALTALKVRLFWSRWEIPNNKDIYFATDEFTPILRLLPLGFGLIGPLALVGLALCYRRPVALFPVWGFVFIYTISVVLFFCTSRYRIPVVPPLILLAVYAVECSVKAFWKRRWPAVASGAVLLVGAGALVHVKPRTTPFRNEAFALVRLGASYVRQGNMPLAEQSYSRAVTLAPNYISARFRYAEVLRESNRLPEAIAEYRKALSSQNQRVRGETGGLIANVHFRLASALETQGYYREALSHYQAARTLDPGRYGKRCQAAIARLSAISDQSR